MNLAIKYEHYKLALWMSKNKFEFHVYSQVERNFLCRPFTKEKDEHKMLINRFIGWRYRFADFAYWGNIDMLAKTFCTYLSDCEKSEILEHAILGGQTDVLDIIYDFDWGTFSYFDAANANRKNVLSWGLEKEIPFNDDASTLYDATFITNIKNPSYITTKELETQKILVEWIEENNLIIDHENEIIRRE